ncbi:flavin reductase family protein [Aspergillus saccharolyticus JOP 1030-1]|uniref:Flavin reductase like domain-containing protein n=1 Tax=Aspergillus saccharolyticus JOP 1030-1 TaxID=1450539 RepID=A0A318Z4R1_9EURO|nr:hypothetical protein BP01DRAFT_394457 [Aspergillus saccharolyticus JOP 1030-1]PYH42066.1 hypothetical protein BP01DRAFT_394457 [Aspergillus saccharolyticus JOP 1030-1]
MPPYSRHMFAASRTAASSSLRRALTPVPTTPPIIPPRTLRSTPQPTYTNLRTLTTTTTTSSSSPGAPQQSPTHNQEHHQVPQKPPYPAASQTHTQAQPHDLPTQIRLLMRQVPYPVAIITATDPQQPQPQSQSQAPKTTSTSTSTSTTRFRGMTVSSFNTVTLHPSPIISFNVRRPSETLSALQSSGRFLVHLLAPTAQTAALAREFSRGNRHLAISEVATDTTLQGGAGGRQTQMHKQAAAAVAEAAPVGASEYDFTPLQPLVLENEGHDAGCLPLPLLRRRDSVVSSVTSTGREGQATTPNNDFPFVLECRLLPQSVQVQDHTIVVGRVVRAILSGKQGQQEGKEAAAVGGHATTKQEPRDLCLTYADTRFWEMGREL